MATKVIRKKTNQQNTVHNVNQKECRLQFVTFYIYPDYTTTVPQDGTPTTPSHAPATQ